MGHSDTREHDRAWTHSRAEQYNRAVHPYFAAAYESQAAFALQEPDRLMISVGCGTGKCLENYLNRGGAQAIGIDIAQNYLEYTQTNLKNYIEAGRLTLIHADATDLRTALETAALPESAKAALEKGRVLLACVTNTPGNMDGPTRKKVLAEMGILAGENGRILLGLFNQKSLHEAVRDFYNSKETTELLQGQPGENDVDYEEGWVKINDVNGNTRFISHWGSPEKIRNWFAEADNEIARSAAAENQAYLLYRRRKLEIEESGLSVCALAGLQNG